MPVMNLDVLMQLGRQHHFEVLVVPVDKQEHDRVRKGATVLVQQYIRNVGTEQIAHYRTTSGGYLKDHNGLAANPYHINVEFLKGYRVSGLHPDEWRFFLHGKPARPDDDPGTPWARFGEYVWRDGQRLNHTDFYARQAAEQERMAEIDRRQHAEHVAWQEARIRALPPLGVRPAKPVTKARSSRNPRVLSEQPGLGSGHRGLYGRRDTEIIEYVVHPHWDHLDDAQAEPGRAALP